MQIKCPVCDKGLMSDRAADFSGVLRKHLMDDHAFSGEMIAVPSPTGDGSDHSKADELERKVTTFKGEEGEYLSKEAKEKVSEVTQFKEDRGAPTREEHAATTFSGMDHSKSPEETKKLVRDVTQFKSGGDIENKSQCFVRTHSSTMCEVQTDYTKELLEKVRRLRNTRHAQHMRVSGFACPVCGQSVEGNSDEELTDDLEVHFIEVHGLEER